MLAALGSPLSVEDVGSLMVNQGLVTPALGLLDGSGAGLAAFLAAQSGWPAHSRYPCSWDDLLDLPIGSVPAGLGGAGWYHWVGARDWRGADVWLANSADGYQGVGQYLDEWNYGQLGPFAAVWIAYEEEGALSAAEQDELAAFRAQQPYYDTALGTPAAPGGLVAQALGTMESACGLASQQPDATATTQALSSAVLGQCHGLRAALGLPA
jgi:hypothetical protein